MRGLALALSILTAACSSTAAGRSGSAPTTEEIYLPATATGVQYRAQNFETTYTVNEAFPAPRFGCGVNAFMLAHHWRPLREDAMNRGMAIAVGTEWAEGFTDRSTEGPQIVAQSEWIDEAGDLVHYYQRYPKAAATAPTQTTMSVAVLRWPAAIARAQFELLNLGPRVEELKALRFLTPVPAMSSPETCDAVLTSPLVHRVADGAPVTLAPFALSDVHSIEILSDLSFRGETSTLKARLTAALRARAPGLRVGTNADAFLDFNATCRCDVPGVPRGYDISEAVLYRASIHEIAPDGTPLAATPAQILFYWTNHGDAKWRHVPASCSSRALTPACAKLFNEADVAFVDDLAVALAAAAAPPIPTPAVQK